MRKQLPKRILAVLAAAIMVGFSSAAPIPVGGEDEIIKALGGVGTLASDDPSKFRAHIIDVGTGLGVYMEFPGLPGERPYRVVYDAGKGMSEGLENDMVSFLTSPEIGLRPAGDDFEGDVIDYFLLSHPHEDHFNGGRPIFDLFDVRNVIESKQAHSYKYLRRFKASAVNEILDAKAAGKDAHYYVAALPYPNGFDKKREGQAYDEYALCQSNLPELLKDQVDCGKHRGIIRFPFGPEQVSQPVSWPVRKLMGENPKGLSLVKEEYLETSLEVDVLPLGTQFRLGRHGGFTIVHGDTIAGLDHANHDRKTYAAAWPYYKASDLNDGSLSIQAVYKRASLLLPGDTEGRDKKPTKRVSLTEIFGTGEGDDAYSQAELEAYLNRDRPVSEQLPLLPAFERYIVSAPDLLRLGLRGYVTMDRITPEGFKIKLDGEPREIPGNDFKSPEDIDESMILWDQRTPLQQDTIHPEWKRRMFTFYEDLRLNRQKWTALKTRFTGWNRGAIKRLIETDGQYALDWVNPVYNITNLVQLTERIYYIDPGLANIFAGFIMRSKIFRDYVAPPEKKDWAKRGEKHMIDVAKQIKAESGMNVLKSDVLVFGHHGSFTSSSLGFVHAVDPNVGIISADDKSYSGSTLPDFSALFWNMNSHHPDARKILHSLFFHADLLALKRGEPVDAYAKRNRYSQGAAQVFKARRRWPIPIWRTDFNDDLENVNTLMDNVLIETDGERPIWDWARHRKKGKKGSGMDAIPDDADPNDYKFWSQELITQHPAGSPVVRPKDPSGVMRTYDITHQLPMLEALRRAGVPDRESEEDFEPEDWTLDGDDDHGHGH